MTDEELLELAAKAAGWTWWRSKHGYWNLTSPEGNEHTACQNWSAYDPYTGAKLTEPTAANALREIGFDPENDDGDALRLAIKLRMRIATPTTDTDCAIAGCGDVRGVHVKAYSEDEITDIYAATRRAITRAAAEIGKGMI